MGITRTYKEYRARWGERIKVVAIAAFSAIAARAAADDIAFAVVAVVLLVGAGEVAADWIARYGFRKRISFVARSAHRRRRIRSRKYRARAGARGRGAAGGRGDIRSLPGAGHSEGGKVSK